MKNKTNGGASRAANDADIHANEINSESIRQLGGDEIFAESDTPQSISFDDERILWQGRPSQFVNSWTYFCCLFGGVYAFQFMRLWPTNYSYEYYIMEPYVSSMAIAFIGYVFLAALHAFLSVRYQRTIITHNKIQEQKGITRMFRQEKFCEISDIRDIKSPPPGIVLGLFNLSHLMIETNDIDQPVIQIKAIKNREQLVSKLLPMWRKLKLERKGFFSDRAH